MRFVIFIVSVMPLFLLDAAASGKAPPALARTALDEYVQKLDPTYTWKVEKTISGNPSTTYIIHLTSQTWRDTSDVNRPVWEHWLVVVKPSKLKTDKAFLAISGGSNGGEAPKGASAVVARIAEATGSIVAELKMIPNQPLVFKNDGQPRKEDDLIGYGWSEYLATGDATWLPRLPMVKSVVRAMDCLQEWSKKEGAEIQKFVIAGASKRGWTTWLAGATDPRIEAIVPIVIDVVNARPSIRHHGEVYGFWAKAIGNYYQHKILQRSDHPRLAELYRIEDPYSYIDRLTMPKYIINGSGDQFFVPDSSKFYFDDLKGEKHLRYVPNADHSVDGDFGAILSMVAFYQMVIAGKPRPEIDWKFEGNGDIRVHSNTPPQQVLLWQATNPNARDFRVATIGKAYTKTELKPESDGSWLAHVRQPEKGWTAAFVELSFDTGSFPFVESTAVRILPDVLPHAGVDPKTLEYEPNISHAGSAK